MTLMLQALDFCDKAGIKIGNDELVRATHIFTNAIFHAYKITPQMVHGAAAKVHALQQDPVAMEKMKLKAGFTKDPRAGTPTPLPDGDDNAGSD